jgi:L-asparaginase II
MTAEIRDIAAVPCALPWVGMPARIGGEPLVDVIRGDRIESVHEAAAYAVDARGRILLEFGNVDVPVYLRSAAKPFVAATAVLAGVVERFGLTRSELAVMTASHAGEPYHVNAVRSILSKIGSGEGALQCGADLPYDRDARAALERRGIAPAAIYNNCSGKHAGILALCAALGAEPDAYLELENPAQQRILAVCAGAAGKPVTDLPIAVDGCGIPAYAVSLRDAARSYLHLATLDGDVDPALAGALRTVRQAMLAHPDYVSGTREFDAALMRAGNGRLVCKGGAEGIHATAAIARRAALVVKVVDGNERARPPAALAALRAAGLVSEVQFRALGNFATPPLTDRAGRIVGELRSREVVQA